MRKGGGIYFWPEKSATRWQGCCWLPHPRFALGSKLLTIRVPGFPEPVYHQTNHRGLVFPLGIRTILVQLREQPHRPLYHTFTDLWLLTYSNFVLQASLHIFPLMKPKPRFIVAVREWNSSEDVETRQSLCSDNWKKTKKTVHFTLFKWTWLRVWWCSGVSVTHVTTWEVYLWFKTPPVAKLPLLAFIKSFQQ